MTHDMRHQNFSKTWQSAASVFILGYERLKAEQILSKLLADDSDLLRFRRVDGPAQHAGHAVLGRQYGEHLVTEYGASHRKPNAMN